MAAETRSFVKLNTNAKVTLYDGTGVPVSLELALDKGDFKCGPFGVGGVLNELVKTQRRGKHVSEGFGERIYPTVSLSSFIAQFSDSTATLVTDFLLKTNKYSANVSTRGSGTNVPYLIDLWYHVEGTDGNGQDSDIYIADIAINPDSLEEGSDGWSISFQGDVLGKIYRGTSRSGTVIAQEIS